MSPESGSSGPSGMMSLISDSVLRTASILLNDAEPRVTTFMILPMEAIGQTSMFRYCTNAANPPTEMIPSIAMYPPYATVTAIDMPLIMRMNGNMNEETRASRMFACWALSLTFTNALYSFSS